MPQGEQLSKVSSSQIDTYVTSEGPGAAENKKVATWRQKESVPATSW